MSLRARKYGDEWDPVWKYLSDRYDYPGPLELDDAVDEIVVKLREKQGVAPGRVAPTVYELIGEADQIGLRQDQVERIADIVEADPERRNKLLEDATEQLGWDREPLHDWNQQYLSDISAAPDLADTVMATPPPLTLLSSETTPPSLAEWTQHLAAADLLVGKPLPDAPSCSSVNVAGGKDGRATTVRGRFEINAEVKDLIYATDPVNWPACSWFFISMTRQGAVTPLQPPDDEGGIAYTSAVDEVVGLEDVLTVSTGLTARFFVGLNSVGMEFDLRPGTHGDGKIDVDYGFLLAEKHPTKQDTLIVTSQKTFSFVGLSDLPFSFLCEFGWIDMMRAMAQCRAPGGGTP